MMQKRSVLDIPLFHKIYGLYKLLDHYHNSIPKAQRYTLWQRCENTALTLLENLIATSHLKEEKRIVVLYQMSNSLDLLKVLIRLAKETRAINLKQYIAIQQQLQEIGKMIGGWIKSVPH